MGSYILRRLLQSIVVVIGVTLVTFLALQAGGDPTYLFVSERASQEEIETTRRALGFDRPLHVQYASFVGDLARGSPSPTGSLPWILSWRRSRLQSN